MAMKNTVFWHVTPCNLISSSIPEDYVVS